MGCTWISLASLIVLIFASFMANMQATSPTITRQHQTTALVKTPIESTASQHTINNIITTSAIEVTKFNFGTRNQIQSTTEKDKHYLSQISNCTFSGHSTADVNCSSGTTSSSTELDEKYPERKVTYRDFKEYKYYKNLYLVAPYIANSPGFITNSLTILVALKIKPLHTSEIYMIVLGCADLLTATSKFTLRMVEKYVETSSATCKTLWYIVTVGQVYSNFILVSWTIERFIAVMFPIKLASWCSIRNTKITASLLLILCLVLTVPYITETDVINVWNGRVIVTTCIFSNLLNAVWFHIESVYYIYLPMIFLCACNLTILCRLSATSKARINMASNQETIDKKSKENRKMTILLLTISGTFLLLHIPYAIVMFFTYIYPDATVLLQKDPHVFAKFIFYTSVGYTVTEFQNSINFFLYCISGTKFRLTLKKLICQRIATKPKERS